MNSRRFGETDVADIQLRLEWIVLRECRCSRSMNHRLAEVGISFDGHCIAVRLRGESRDIAESSAAEGNLFSKLASPSSLVRRIVSGPWVAPDDTRGIGVKLERAAQSRLLLLNGLDLGEVPGGRLHANFKLAGSEFVLRMRE